MDTYFPEWYGNMIMSPNSELTQLRQESIEDFSASIESEDHSSADIMALSRFAFGLPEATPKYREEVLNKVRKSFTKNDTTFAIRGNDQEMRILSGGILECLLKGQSDVTDVAALSTICAQEIKGISEGCGNMHNDLRDGAIYHLQWQGERRRTITPQSKITIAPAHIKFAESLKKVKPESIALDEKLPAFLLGHINSLTNMITELTENLNTAQTKILNNQIIFEEEIDILWWLFSGQSRDLNEPITSIGIKSACLIIAKELADLTKILPGHQNIDQFISAALYKAQLNSAESSQNGAVNLTDAISSTPRSWREQWRNSFKEAMVPLNVSSLCPIIKGVELSLQTDGDEWTGFWRTATGLQEDLAQSPLDVSLQLYRECLLLRVIG